MRNLVEELRDPRYDSREEMRMATIGFNRSVGMIVLAIWLILHGLLGFVTFAIPPAAMGALAIIAGVLILIGR